MKTTKTTTTMKTTTTTTTKRENENLATTAAPMARLDRPAASREGSVAPCCQIVLKMRQFYLNYYVDFN